MTANKEVTFSNLENVKSGECVEFNTTDADGNPAVIGIELVSFPGRGFATQAASKTWKVYYTGGLINCYFYMAVSNNKVTSVYDDWILIIGGIYDNASLTRTSTYGKLTFRLEAYAGVMSSTCWLKGIVTGSDNNISVTWEM